MRSLLRLSAPRLGKMGVERPPDPVRVNTTKGRKSADYQYERGSFWATDVDPLSRGQQWVALPFAPRAMPRDHPRAAPHVSLRAVSADLGVLGKWHVIDAKGMTVGRLASVLAPFLMGKHRVDFSKNIVLDQVIVVNAIHLVLPGHTWDTKIYKFPRKTHSQGPVVQSAQDIFRRNPSTILNMCVRKMLPKNEQRNARFSKLLVYPGAIHPHHKVPQVIVPSESLSSDSGSIARLNEQVLKRTRKIQRAEQLWKHDSNRATRMALKEEMSGSPFSVKVVTLERDLSGNSCSFGERILRQPAGQVEEFGVEEVVEAIDEGS